MTPQQKIVDLQARGFRAGLAHDDDTDFIAHQAGDDFWISDWRSAKPCPFPDLIRETPAPPAPYSKETHMGVEKTKTRVRLIVELDAKQQPVRFQWEERVELIDDGKVASSRLDLVDAVPEDVGDMLHDGVVTQAATITDLTAQLAAESAARSADAQAAAAALETAKADAEKAAAAAAAAAQARIDSLTEALQQKTEAHDGLASKLSGVRLRIDSLVDLMAGSPA